MKSKVSFFNIQSILVKENLRKLWGLPLLFTLIMFFANIFPVIMEYDDLANHRYVLNVLRNDNGFNIIVFFVAPIIASILLFRYLQVNNSVSAIHALPFKRKELFASHIFTGLIIIATPILITTAFYLLVRKPIMSADAIPIDLFSASAILLWAKQSLIVVFAIFSISVFAAIITGNTGVQSVFSICFVFFITVTLALFTPFLQHYLYGYFLSWETQELFISLSPILLLSEPDNFEGKFIAFHLILSVVLIIVSYFLYQKRQLEKSSEAICFKYLQPIFKYYAAFIGMAALGYYLYGVTDQILSLYLGYFFGGLITYFIAEMVINKTIWVFRHYKGFLIFIIAGALFIGVLKVDVTGFESRVPSVSNIKSFSFYSGEEHQYNDQYNIVALTNFHQSIIDQKESFEKYKSYDNRNALRNVHIVYTLKNGKNMSRSYLIPMEHFENSMDIKKIYESNEHAHVTYDVLFSNIKQDYIYLEPDFGKNEVKLVDPMEIRAFLSAVKKDILEESFEDMNSETAALASIELIGKEQVDEEYNREYRRPHDYIRIKHTYTNTINWLKQHKYYDAMITTSKDIKYTQIEYRDDSEDNVYQTKTTVLSSNIPESTPDKLIITDPAQTQQLIEMHSNYSKSDEYYIINFVMKNGQDYYGHISKKNAPQFIMTHFNK